MNTDYLVFIEFEYTIKDGKCKVLDTNIKKERIEDFLEEWIMDQVGRGEDTNSPVIRDTYRIKIGCDLTDDTFYTQSDAGNKGLTTGIVSHVWSKKLWEQPTL
jgi:hypothetical protein